MLVLTVLGSVGLYATLNHHLASAAAARTLSSPIDDLVPFNIHGMFLYGGIYAIALTPACLIEDRRLLMRCALGFMLLLASAIPFWLLWPVTVPRTPLAGDGLLQWGLAFVRWADPPMNCFPSMHVGETVLAAYFCARMDRRAGLLVGLLALGVWWSTMAIDQHWFVDGLVGAALALVVGFAVLAVRPLPPGAFQPASLVRLLWAVGLYIVMFSALALPWLAGWATAPDLRSLTS
ncbi:MAG: phosphatase PAP2 family protein [Myxococcota bacterium]|nr:phosphatase PAP2 family protein [Myxococcota bacterium]